MLNNDFYVKNYNQIIESHHNNLAVLDVIEYLRQKNYKKLAKTC